MDTNFSLRELSPSVGVEVLGVDLRKPVEEAVATALRQAFKDRLLVLFRGQQLSEEDHVRAVSIFGPPLDEFADGTSYSLVSNLDRDAYIGGSANDSELIYHSDLTNTEAPIAGLSLYAMEVSDDAPGTRYVNAQHAYKTLPQRLRDRLDRLTVTDGYEKEVYGDPALDASDGLMSGIRTSHPAVINHPRNGRRQIFCNRMWTHRIDGMDKAAAKSLLAEVFAHLYAASNLHEHRWANGDLIIWDNIGLQHGRDPVPPGCLRRLRRVPWGESKPAQAVASRQIRERALQDAAARG